MEEEKELTIDFGALWRVIKKGKWLISSTGLLFAIITAVIVFNQPNEYSSTASVMPELESNSISGGLSQFAGLASLAGVDLASMSSSDAVRPDLYPSIINNTSFFLFLLEQDVNTAAGDSVNFLNFYKDVYEIESDSTEDRGLLFSIKNIISSDQSELTFESDSTNSLIFLPKVKGEIVEELSDKIVSQIDKKTGIVSISVELPDPVTAAHVAKISMDYLTNFVTSYRTEKAKKDLDFITQQLNAARGKFYYNQAKKAQYSDQFQAPTIRLQSADIQRERIESNYQVSSSFYSQLQKQYETAMMKVQEQTPVFKMLDSPVIPYKKSGPKRTLAVLGAFIFFSIICTIVLILINYKQILAEINARVLI